MPQTQGRWVQALDHHLTSVSRSILHRQCYQADLPHKQTIKQACLLSWPRTASRQTIPPNLAAIRDHHTHFVVSFQLWSNHHLKKQAAASKLDSRLQLLAMDSDSAQARGVASVRSMQGRRIGALQSAEDGQNISHRLTKGVQPA